jgi:hypothetical protein
MKPRKAKAIVAFHPDQKVQRIAASMGEVTGANDCLVDT